MRYAGSRSKSMCSLRIWPPFFISTQSGPKRVDFFRRRSKFKISKFSTRLSPHTSVGTRVKHIPIIPSHRSKSQLSLEKSNIFYQKLKKIQLCEIWVKCAFFSWKIDCWKNLENTQKMSQMWHFFTNFTNFYRSLNFFLEKIWEFQNYRRKGSDKLWTTKKTFTTHNTLCGLYRP